MNLEVQRWCIKGNAFIFRSLKKLREINKELNVTYGCF